MEIRCKKCGSTKVFTDTKGSQTGIYCSDCGKWIKWATKDEIRLIDHNSTSDAKLTVDTISGLQEKIAEQIRTIRWLMEDNDSMTYKLERIVNIVNDYDGTTPSMIKQFSEIQKVLEENN